MFHKLFEVHKNKQTNKTEGQNEEGEQPPVCWRLSLFQESSSPSLTQSTGHSVSPTLALFPTSLLPAPRQVLTTSILIAVVPTVVVPIALPLGGDAGTFTKGTHGACEVTPTTGTLGAAGQAWTEGKEAREGLASAEAPGPGVLAFWEP